MGVLRKISPHYVDAIPIPSSKDFSIDYFGFLKILPPPEYPPVMNIHPSSIN